MCFPPPFAPTRMYVRCCFCRWKSYTTSPTPHLKHLTRLIAFRFPLSFSDAKVNGFPAREEKKAKEKKGRQKPHTHTFFFPPFFFSPFREMVFLAHNSNLTTLSSSSFSSFLSTRANLLSPSWFRNCQLFSKNKDLN